MVSGRRFGLAKFPSAINKLFYSIDHSRSPHNIFSRNVSQAYINFQMKKRRSNATRPLEPESVKKVTIAQIAEAAGVSVGLVSSFLSGKQYSRGGRSGIRLGRETAERILAVCRENNYRPDKVAVFNRIYPELAEVAFVGNALHFRFGRYFMIMMDGIVVSAAESNVKVSIMQFDPDIDYRRQPDRLPYSVLEGEISKYVVGGAPNMSFLESLIERGANVVYVSRQIDMPGVVSVVPDYHNAAEIAVRYLYNLGHRRIGFMGFSYFKDGYHGLTLKKGAIDTLKSLGLKWSEDDFQYDEENYTANESQALNRLLAQKSPPSAVFCFDDVSAELLIRAAQNRGLDVPADLSVIGCNDERQAATAIPPLTTVHLPVFEMGVRAVQVVNSVAKQGLEAVDSKIVLPVYLVERASTKALGKR